MKMETLKERKKFKAATTFECSICNLVKPVHTDCGTGYATDRQTDAKICYDCMGNIDRESLKNAKVNDKFIFYLTYKNGQLNVINWCSTIVIQCYKSKKSFHNFAGKNGRTDIWCKFEGKVFWGVNIGDNEILRVKCLK